MRLRITFNKTEDLRFTSHLDLHKAWERTFRRSGLPLAYSQGYRPKPRINLASALPLGFTSECEIADVWLEAALPLAEVVSSLKDALPPGLQLKEVEEAEPRAPKLQSQIQSAEYLVALVGQVPDLEDRIKSLLSSQCLPRERRGKAYDLRPLIENIRYLPDDDEKHAHLLIKLAAREGATGRPEEVVAALGLTPEAARFHRTRLILAEER